MKSAQTTDRPPPAAPPAREADSVPPPAEGVPTGVAPVPQHGSRPRLRVTAGGLRLWVTASRPRLRAWRARQPLDFWPLIGITLVTLGGLAAYLIPLQAVEIDAVNGFGLVSVLPVLTLAGAGVLTVAYLLTLSLCRPYPVFLVAQLVCLVVCLHGVAAIVSDEPRFPTAWQHLGLIEYIARTGDVAPTVDGRFGWPGFFALMAFVTRVTGVDDPTILITPAPVVAQLLFLAAFLLLASAVRASWRTRWFAAFLFVATNWVGQDYLSPQAFNFLLYLLFCAVLLNWFGVPAEVGREQYAEGGPRRRLPWLRRAATPGFLAIPAGGRESRELPPRPATPWQRAFLVVLLVGLGVASAASHQLTPFMMLSVATVLVLARRCELTGLPLLLSVVVVSWINFMASGYWSNHIDEIFDGLGNIGANIGSASGGRVQHTDPQHTTVLYIRLAFTVTMFGLAALGTLYRWAMGIRDRAPVALALAPLGVLAMQNYGGEIGLRVYLFALPALCILVAALFFDGWAGRPSWRAFAAAGGCALVFVGAFLLARFGNEAFERTTSGEIAAMEYVFAHDDRGARVLWLARTPEADETPNMPWGYRDVEKVTYIGAAAPHDSEDISRLVNTLRSLGPGSYLYVNRAQLAFLHLQLGLPGSWDGWLRSSLEAAPGLRAVVANADAALYVDAAAVGEPAQPLPDPPGFTLGATPWTNAGVVVVVALLGLLTAREILRAQLPAPKHRRRLAPLTVAALLLSVGLAAVMVERFLYLT